MYNTTSNKVVPHSDNLHKYFDITFRTTNHLGRDKLGGLKNIYIKHNVRKCKKDDFEEGFKGSVKLYSVDYGLGICPENSSALYVNTTDPGEIFF